MAGLFAFGLAACDTLDPSRQYAVMEQPPVSGRLAPGDKIRVIVFGEDRLSGDYTVDGAGTVSLPLAGTVKVAGLTRVELERELARKFKGDYLKDPKVTVEVVSVRPVYVLGEVGHSGEIPYRDGLNVITAMSLAGGPTYRSSRVKVQILRAGSTTFEEYPMSPSVYLMPGDLMRVPERYF
jgi:protein involved in polysaccharide export with SLBB domain